MLRRERQTSGNFPNAPTIAEAGEWTKYSTAVAGTLLALVGLFVPSASIIAFLNSDPGPLQDELLLGATLLRAGLVLLGVIVVGLGRLPVWRTPPPATAVADETRTDIYTWLLGGVLLVSTALRLVALNSGLWLDEILTYVQYARLPFGEIVTTYSSENQHFLFSILARGSFALFGESAWALRLPAVLFGVGSLGALFLLGRLVSDEREALLATALLAFSYHHVWFSQNARGYSGLLFWTLLSTWLFYLALRRQRSGLWLFYAAAAALGVYTHITMVFVVVGHSVIYVVELLRHWPNARRSRWRGLFLGLAMAAFLTLLLYALVLPQMLGGVAASESVVDTWKNPLWTALEFVRGLQVGFSNGVVVVAALVLFVLGLASNLRERYGMVVMIAVPSLVGAAVTVALGHHLWPRFFFFTFGFGALVVVRGVMVASDLALRIVRQKPERAVTLGTALCLLMIAISAASVPFAFGPKQDYDGARAYVENARQPGDAVVSVGLAGYVYENFYRADWAYVESPEELDAVRAGAAATWMVYSFVPVLESVQPAILATIERDCSAGEEFPGSVAAGTILVCRLAGPPS